MPDASGIALVAFLLLQAPPGDPGTSPPTPDEPPAQSGEPTPADEPAPNDEPPPGTPISRAKVRPSALSGLRGGSEPADEVPFPEPSARRDAVADPEPAAAAQVPAPAPPPTTPAGPAPLPPAPAVPIAPPPAPVAPLALNVDLERLALLTLLLPATAAAGFVLLGARPADRT